MYPFPFQGVYWNHEEEHHLERGQSKARRRHLELNRQASVSVDEVSIDEVEKKEAHPPGPGNSCVGKPPPCTPTPAREYTGTTKKAIIQREALHIVSLPHSGGRSFAEIIRDASAPHGKRNEGIQDANHELAPLVEEQEA